MIELHLHLDGSLFKEDLSKLYDISGLDKTELDNAALTKKGSFKDLNEYLSCFEAPLKCLQCKEAIKEAVILLMSRISRQGVYYAEIRFAPQLSTKEGLSQEEVVLAAIEGLNEGKKRFEMLGNLILCAMRGEGNDKENLETALLCKKYLGKGVVALDLAGAEGLYKTSKYKDLFDYAKNNGIPFTIHAGEADGHSSVDDAISFGACRIGHGVNARESEDTMKALREKKIPVEICPTSEVDTHCVSSIKDLPIKEFIRKGILVTISTDDMAISNVTLIGEMRLLQKELGFDDEDIVLLLDNAITASFASEAEKEKMRAMLYC